MGAAASVDSAASWSKKDVAERVAMLGQAFEGYSQFIEKNALDGPMLLSLDEGELDDWFDEVEVKKIHRKVLAKEFKALQVSSSLVAAESKPEAKSSASEPEPTPKGKRFAGFLSHYKRECGTEARLVQQNLKNILPSGQDVFLDSGKSAPPCVSVRWPSLPRLALGNVVVVAPIHLHRRPLGPAPPPRTRQRHRGVDHSSIEVRADAAVGHP